jgi:hypothetical protein
MRPIMLDEPQAESRVKALLPRMREARELQVPYISEFTLFRREVLKLSRHGPTQGAYGQTEVESFPQSVYQYV